MACVRTGTPCETTQRFRALPLPSHKSLWEASTHSAWQSEYDALSTMHSRGLSRLGDLIDAHERAGDIANARRLDVWNAGADGLGILLNMVAATV